MKPKLVLGLALVLGGALAAFSSNAADTNTLRVVVIPSKIEVHVKEKFKVALRVENPTTANQTVRVMSCSWYEEWKTSNTNISWVGWVCEKNTVWTIELPPGGAYTNQLDMLIPQPISKKTLSFRMGFTAIGSTNTLWSNEVRLHIANRSPYEAVTTAINHEDWVALQRLAKPGMRANDYIPKWEKNPVRVGKLIHVEKDAKYYLDGKPCTIYSFDWESKDGTQSLHQFQVLVREECGKSIILDFWNFGW